MSRVFPGRCLAPGCPAIQHERYCEKHTHLAPTPFASFKRGKQDRGIYATNKWKQRSVAQRKRQPLCEVCLENGRTIAATQADHRVPMSEGGDPFAWSNLRSICGPCHRTKTGRDIARRRRGDV